MKKIMIIALLILGFIIGCKKNKVRDDLYDVGTIVMVQPDSSRVKIIDYTAWGDVTKYTVEYIDTTRRRVILNTEIIKE